jgi:hypothetical protein
MIDLVRSYYSNTLRLADSALTISSLFLIFFASYSLITLILQIWLFNHAAVPFNYLSLQREEQGLDGLYMMARRGEFLEVFWTWWGHRYSPIGHIFCLIAWVTGIIGVGHRGFGQGGSVTSTDARVVLYSSLPVPFNSRRDCRSPS